MDTSQLIDRIQAKSLAITDLAPREFEEVVAELLASLGWEVNLTPPTREGGVDILGVSRDAVGFETTWIVECKRYRADHPVGVSTLRQLYGVRESLRVPRALLATTSGVTRGAAEFAGQVGIEIADAAVLARWVEQYARPETTPYAISRRLRSCFVSHSTADVAFVHQLVHRLRAAGVRVWYAPEDLVPGRKIHEEVAEAIATFDRLVVVLSDASIASSWVQTEVRWARRREIKESARVLFPVSLLPFERLKNWQLFDADSGQDLAAELREYFVADFSEWHSDLAFQQGMVSLLRGLEDAVDRSAPDIGARPT